MQQVVLPVEGLDVARARRQGRSRSRAPARSVPARPRLFRDFLGSRLLAPGVRPGPPRRRWSVDACRLVAHVRCPIELQGRPQSVHRCEVARQSGSPEGPRPRHSRRATVRAPAATARPPEPRRSAVLRLAPPGSARRSPPRGPRRAASARRPQRAPGRRTGPVRRRSDGARRPTPGRPGVAGSPRRAAGAAARRRGPAEGCRSRRSASWCSPVVSSAGSRVVTSVSSPSANGRSATPSARAMRQAGSSRPSSRRSSRSARTSGSGWSSPAWAASCSVNSG